MKSSSRQPFSDTTNHDISCCAVRFIPSQKQTTPCVVFFYSPIDRNKSIRGDFHLEEKKKCSFPHHGFSILILYSGSRVNIKLSFRRLGFFSFRMETSTFFFLLERLCTNPHLETPSFQCAPFRSVLSARFGKYFEDMKN